MSQTVDKLIAVVFFLAGIGWAGVCWAIAYQIWMGKR